MREVVDFRISEEYARATLPDDVGKRLGDSIRQVVVRTSDPIYAQIRRLDHEFSARGDFFFTSAIPRRIYSRRELEAAELLYIWPRRAFEPTGEECGTVYDETDACNHIFARTEAWELHGHKMPARVEYCGVGAKQVTPLFLDGRHIPHNVDFSRTIADEVVASARVRDVFAEEELRGANFDPVRLCEKGGRPSTEHYQLKALEPLAELDSSTRAGGRWFDDSSYGRCPHGHKPGINLLSEVMIERRSLHNADFMATRQMIGTRGGGLLRPTPILLISPKAWRAIEKHKLKGLTIEVAHVV